MKLPNISGFLICITYIPMSLVADFSAQFTKGVPALKSGQTVRVHQKIQEGEKTRIQIFEGLIIRINPGNGSDATFTVRKIVDGIGVEKIFPLYSANIAKIEVKKVSRVRRSKLYFMRKRRGKSVNLRDLHVDLPSSDDSSLEEAAPVVPVEVSAEEAKDDSVPTSQDQPAADIAPEKKEE